MRSSTARSRPERKDEIGDRRAALTPAFSKLDRTDRIVAVCDAVFDIAAAWFNVSGREMRYPGRSPLGLARVRQIAMYVTHVSLRISMRDVGEGFGRDRTTVLHACHQVEDMRDDEVFDQVVVLLERVVRAAFGETGDE